MGDAMKKGLRKFLQVCLFALPLILGFGGLLQAGENILDALFSAITMYGL